MRTEYLRDLGLETGKTYTTTEIKVAWRKLCLKHHPDKGGDVKEFHKVTHAYKMLTEPAYRHQEEVRNKGPKGGLDINMSIPITFDDAFFGREVMVTFNTVEIDSNHKPLVDKKFDVICEKVTVPEGNFAFSHTIKGKGLKRGDEVGNTFVTFQAMPHPKFRMEGNDVCSIESVPLDILLRGGEIDVITMWGIRKVKVLPGSGEGTSIYIKECGIRKTGRHRIQLKVIYPTKDELKKNSNWKGLDIDWAEEEVINEDPQDTEYSRVFANLGGFTTSATGGF